MPKYPEVFRLLRSFDNKDFIYFEKFLKSPFLNNRFALISIFNNIRNNKNLLLLSNTDELEKYLINNSKYSKGTINKLLSYLKNAVIKYYSLKNVLADDIYLSLKLNDYLLNIGELKILNLNQDKLKSLIFDSSKIDEDTFKFSHLLNDNLFNTTISSLNYWKRKKNNLSKHYIHKSSIDIYLYTLIQLVYGYLNFVLCDINYNHDNFQWQSVDLDNYINSGSFLLQENNNKYYKVVYNLYKKLYFSFKFINVDKYYKNYKSYFLSNIDIFKNSIIKQHYSILINYCAARE